MTEQQKLSDCYMNLKIKYWNLKKLSGNCEEITMDYEVVKDKNRVLRTKNTELGEQKQKLETDVNELRRKIRELEKVTPGAETDQIVTMTRVEVQNGQYVTLKKYEKMKKLMETMAGKVCDLTRDNEQLKRQIR